VLRDVIAREVPALLRAESELFAVAGALVVGIASSFDVDGPALGAAERQDPGPGCDRASKGPRGGSVIDDVIARWHRYLGGELPGGLDELLADDVVFYSPVVYTPQRGKAITTQYLEAASRALVSDAETFRYTKQVLSGDTAVLEFETSVEGRFVNGVDIIRVDDAGRIVEFRVMMRPLQGIRAVHEQMGRLLAAGG
jgi:hypothetical protein